MQRDARERPQEMGVCAPSFCHTRYEHAISLGVHARHFVSGERRKNNADGEVCGADSLGVRGQVTAGRPAGPITSPGRPAATPHMHSGRNSNNPESSSMEFHRAGGRQINHRLWEAADRKQGTGKDSSRERGTEGGTGGEQREI